MRRTTVFAIAAVIAIVSVVALYADIIVLNTGGRIEGEILGKDEDGIRLKTRYGFTYIRRNDVEEIIEKLTPWEEYSERSAKIEEFDAQAHYELALWCKKSGLQQEYEEEIKLVLSLNERHAGALKEYEEIRAAALKRLDARKALSKKRAAGRHTAGKRTAPKREGKGRPVVAVDAAKKREIEQLVEDYFKVDKEDYEGRQKVLKKLTELDPISKSLVKQLRGKIFKLAFKGPKCAGGGRVAGKITLQDSAYPGQYIINVPGGAKGGKQYPLLIGLHGGGAGVGDGANSARKWSGALGKGCICVFPTVVKKEATAWNREREEKYVLRIIEEVKRTYPVDTNRIYLCGHSMGGYGAWAIGTHYADVFAALAPCAGGIFVMVGGGGVTLARGTVVNLKATPIYFYHGSNDPQVPPASDRKAAEALEKLKKEHGPYEYVYKEYDGIGHGLPPGGLGQIINWLAQHKRNPYPKKIIWEPSRRYKRLFWWLKNEGGVTDQIIAEFDKGKNIIKIKNPGGASGISIFLNEKMINFSKPVQVLVNNEEIFNDYAPYSAAALLESIDDKKDPNQFFTARIDLK